jgi:putative sterol carrier protein
MSQEFLFPSREWAEEWCRLLNESKEYYEAAKTTPWDSVVLISTNVPESVRKALNTTSTAGAIKLNIKGGKCLGAEFYTEVSNVSGAIVLEAPYDTWVKILQGKLDITVALLGGSIKVKKGSLTELARYTNAAVIMSNLSKKVKSKILT